MGTIHPRNPLDASDQDADSWHRESEAEATVRVLRAASFELIPLPHAFDRATAVLPPGASVTVTVSPAKGLDPMLELCERLAGAGYLVTPHLAARSVRDRMHLADVLARLVETRTARVFVVAGDAKEPGEYPDGLSLLRAIEGLGYRFKDVGIPAYPDGHPFIPKDTLWRALLDKQPYATYATTQLCYDAATIAAWVREARRSGLKLPLEIGLPGPVDFTRLLRVSSRIGIRDSARYLRKNRGLFGALLRRPAFRPDRLLSALGTVFADPAAGVFALHVYSFGQVADAVGWQVRTLDHLG